MELSGRNLSSLACDVCNLRKKKCDKQQPRCSLCSRKGLACTYSQPDPARRRIVRPQSQQAIHRSRHSRAKSANADETLPTPPSPPTTLRHTSASLTAIYLPVCYLDSNIARKYQVEIPLQDLPLPPDVSDIIGGPTKWEAIATEYFRDTHTWMPIVSKKRFYENTLRYNPSQIRSDYALLVLCMDLLLWVPHNQDPQTAAYRSAKSFYLELEIQGVVSIQVLQAQILIATFEFGHGIFPSAAISIEGSVRYGQALGINWDAKHPAKRPFAWVDLEEQNRVWWAIVILDRMLGIGYAARPLLTEEPSINVYLPSDDLAWDLGSMPQAPSKRVGAFQNGSNQDIGRFALAAETIRLLGQVLRHIRSDRFGHELHNEEARLLDGALRALESVVEFEGQNFSISVMNQKVFCSVTLLILHEAYAFRNCAMSSYFESTHYAREAINLVANSRAAEHDSATQKSFPSCVTEASPFLTAFVYYGSVTNLRWHRERGTRDSLDHLLSMKAALKDFDQRWRLAGAYLQILEAREISPVWE